MIQCAVADALFLATDLRIVRLRALRPLRRALRRGGASSVSKPAVFDMLATVSAAMPARTKPLSPIKRPSTAAPTSAAAGNIKRRASMTFAPGKSKFFKPVLAHRHGECTAHAPTRERAHPRFVPAGPARPTVAKRVCLLGKSVSARRQEARPRTGSEPAPDEEAGHGRDQQRAEHLLARAFAHHAGGVVHGLLGGFCNRHGRLLQIDSLRGGPPPAPLGTIERDDEAYDAEHGPRTAENAQGRQRAVVQPQPFVQRRDAEAERQQNQDRPRQGEHRRHDGFADLALEVDAEQAQHGAEHQRRPVIRPMTRPRHNAPVTTASGLRRATRSSSATMALASSFADDAISAPRSPAASPRSEPSALTISATVSLRLDTSLLSFLRSADRSSRPEAAVSAICSLTRCHSSPTRPTAASVSFFRLAPAVSTSRRKPAAVPVCGLAIGISSFWNARFNAALLAMFPPLYLARALIPTHQACQGAPDRPGDGLETMFHGRV